MLEAARRLSAETPPDRNRVVDLMRVLSILVVVFGHWLMAAVTVTDGELVPGHLLEMAEWTHPLTWIFQVMPVFFFVGGFSNARSWRSAQRRGEPYGSWLRARLRRLLMPVIPLLVVWTLFGWIALRAGLPWDTLRLGSQVALVPTWFLAAYVIIVLLAPAALALWKRFSWWSVVAGLALAAISDVLSIAGGVVWVGFLNYVFVWGTVHQLGYAWVDGRIEGMARRWGLLAIGLLATLALVSLGPYPVAMVGLDTAQLTNSYPPRVTLAFLGMFQAGLVLVAEPLLERWMQRALAWFFVVAVSVQIMTVYLWHLTAMVIVIGLSILLGGVGLGVEPLSGTWWATRPIWFLVVGVVTLVLVSALRRFERPPPETRPSPPAWQPVLAAVLACGGLGLLAAIGIADEDGLNGFIVALPLVGVVVGGVADLRRFRSTDAPVVP
ncbi:MAG: acyltransferase [Acidimicrobiales bacterium]|nr:acyltransferase [Acidimicrobiales bacterium]HLV91314.1 acyltransferase [Acidimicrobiia bacterium]